MAHSLLVLARYAPRVWAAAASQCLLSKCTSAPIALVVRVKDRKLARWTGSTNRMSMNHIRAPTADSESAVWQIALKFGLNLSWGAMPPNLWSFAHAARSNTSRLCVSRLSKCVPRVPEWVLMLLRCDSSGASPDSGESVQ